MEEVNADKDFDMLYERIFIEFRTKQFTIFRDTGPEDASSPL